MNSAIPGILYHVLLLPIIIQIIPSITKSPHIMYLFLPSPIALALWLYSCILLLWFAPFVLIAFMYTVVFMGSMEFRLLLLVSIPMLRGVILLPVVRSSGVERCSSVWTHRIGLLILLRIIKQRIQNPGPLRRGYN